MPILWEGKEIRGTIQEFRFLYSQVVE